MNYTTEQIQNAAKVAHAAVAAWEAANGDHRLPAWSYCTEEYQRQCVLFATEVSEGYDIMPIDDPSPGREWELVSQPLCIDIIKRVLGL